MEEIIKILKGYSDPATKVNGKKFLSETHYKIVEQKITALIESEYVEKEFVEWLPLNTMTDRVTRNKAKYMVMDMNQPAIWMTLNEIRKYWLREVKGK